jgi:hypothetical protein
LPNLEHAPFLDNKNHDTGKDDTTQVLTREEPLPQDICNRFVAPEASTISDQVKLLKAIHHQIASQDSRRQFIWNAVLQVVYVAIGFLFGVFSIFQWHAQWIANGMASDANKLALLAICLSSNSVCPVPYFWVRRD